MSVMKKVNANQSETIELSELADCERKILKLYRLLDEQHKEDILRFINALLHIS
jgi:hypothetical protein